MKRIIYPILSLVLLLFPACNKCYIPIETTDLVATLETKVGNNDNSIDASLDTILGNNGKSWSANDNLNERFEACQVPQVDLNEMTTEALVQAVIHYPLNYLIFTRNCPEDAVALVFEKSSLHQELAKREDAAEILADYFLKYDVDMNDNRTVEKQNCTSLCYADDMFLNYIIASGVIRGMEKPEIRAKLLQAANIKSERRTADSITFSAYSIRPLERISQMLSLTSTEIVKTPFGQDIYGLSLPELTSYEIAIINSTILANYDDAIYRGTATNKYNCHSYAWHMQSTDNTVWINSIYNDALQLSKYWTRDLYVECSSTQAEKVFYPNGDHSAIVLPNGNFLSKWGQGPLMEHSPSCSPYDTTGLRYFKTRTDECFFSNFVSGNPRILVNQSETYHVNYQYPMLTCIWSVDPISTHSDTSYSILYSNDVQCIFRAYEPGAYYLHYKGYYDGYCVLSGYTIIVVTY